MGWTARATLVTMTHKENATAMFLGETGKCLEQGTGFLGLMRIDAQEAVEWIEDQEAGLGSLERIFEERGEKRGRRGGSAQDDEACGIAMKVGEAGGNDLRAVVLHGGVQHGTRFNFFAGTWGSSTGQGGRDGQRDPGFPGSRLAGDHGQGASGEPVLPEPFDGAGLKVSEI